jgi:hypothetical protein
MKLLQLEAAIINNAKQFRKTEEDWEADILEWNTICAIFEYALDQGFQAPGYDLAAILQADDDDDPGVPDIGCEAALIDIMERITREDLPDSIHAPSLNRLLKIMEASFRGSPDN